MKSNKRHPSREKIEKIAIINKELKIHFNTTKAKRVRRNIVPGNTASLWRAVKIAKDINVTSIPNIIKENGIHILHKD